MAKEAHYAWSTGCCFRSRSGAIVHAARGDDPHAGTRPTNRFKIQVPSGLSQALRNKRPGRQGAAHGCGKQHGYAIGKRRSPSTRSSQAKFSESATRKFASFPARRWNRHHGSQSAPSGPTPEKVGQLQDLVGTQFGHFRIESVIAKGHSGLVFKAIDLNEKREVALKVLRPEFSRTRRTCSDSSAP